MKMKKLLNIKNLYSAAMLFFAFTILLKAQYKDGDLVKGSGDKIYIIEDGKACWVSSSDIFDALGLDWKKVKPVADYQLRNMPKDYIIVKGYDKPVYVLYYGIACEVTDLNTLALLGFDRKDIKRIPNSRLRKIPIEPILVKGNDDPVYAIVNGKACWIQSEDAFYALGYNMERIIKVSDNTLRRIPKAPLLLQGSDQKIYVVEKTKRHWIKTPAIFNRMGYDWDTILHVDNRNLKRIPEGKPIR